MYFCVITFLLKGKFIKGNENDRLPIRCYIQLNGDYIALDKKKSTLVLLGTWILYSNMLDSKKNSYWTADTKVHDKCNNAVKSQLIDSLPDSFLTNPLFAIPTPCRLCRNYSTPYPLPDPQCTHRYTTAVLNVVDCRCISVYKICQTLFRLFTLAFPLILFSVIRIGNVITYRRHLLRKKPDIFIFHTLRKLWISKPEKLAVF